MVARTIVSESIKELREICQRSRDDNLFQSDWLDRNLLRHVSIYLTWLFLKVGLSPNKITLLSILPALGAGALFTLPDPKYWLIAWALFFFCEILDCCDGELARYQKSSSLTGEYDDLMAGVYFIRPLLYGCMSFGIYNVLDSITIFVFVFILVTGWMMYTFSPILCQALLSRKSLLQEELKQNEQVKFPKTLSRGIIPYFRLIFNHTWFFLALPVISLLDMFVSPFWLGGLEIDMRYMYIVLFALAVMSASILRVYDVNKYGINLHK
jgi:phosphatidylglycerophosphate synthase